jgi:hypothetical protein
MTKLRVLLLRILTLASAATLRQTWSYILSQKRICGPSAPILRQKSKVHLFATSRRDDSSGEVLRDTVAYPEQTPHSGRHFLPSHPAYKWPLLRRLYWKRRRRFMEGWYYRLTLVEQNVSFAFIVSIEDPGLSPPSDLRLACIQVVGPNDGYLVQADRDDSKFWAWRNQQALGCTFEFESLEVGKDMKFCTKMAPEGKIMCCVHVDNIQNHELII